MTQQTRKKIGVIFGGRSVEHEVSVITGIQAAHALTDTEFQPVPIYVSKDGDWYTGDALLDLESFKDLRAAVKMGTRVIPATHESGGVDLVTPSPRLLKKPFVEHVEVMLVAMHGAEGENGSLQGALEVLNVPYTGSGPRASVIGMDKSLAKSVAKSVGVPVLDELAIPDSGWIGHEDEWLSACESNLGFPLIVKPMGLGSSIGIGKATDRDQLEAALEEVFRLDSRALVEPCIVNLREFNCSVLATASGDRASVVEEPVRLSGSDLLSFEQKYQRQGSKGGSKDGPKSASGQERAGMASLDRIIPADVPDGRTEEVQSLALRVFEAIGCGGVSRIDFLYDEDARAFYFNEINTIPGSFAFYLWQPSGIPFDKLLVEMIEDAIRAHRARNAKIRSYETNLLSANALTGLKS